MSESREKLYCKHHPPPVLGFCVQGLVQERLACERITAGVREGLRAVNSVSAKDGGLGSRQGAVNLLSTQINRGGKVGEPTRSVYDNF